MKTRIFVLALLLTTSAFAELTDANKKAYIERFKNIAISEMHEYGIPASITLAQGILESASGKSYLATKANNHFGIKCHSDWTGRKVYRDDDKKNECFRAYDDPEESYRDHSIFLTTRSRYAFLFKESRTDYKAWAHGLKKAGYATNKKYPQLLIRIIEENNLHQYDLEDDQPEVDVLLDDNPIMLSANQVKYIIAQEGDSYEDISAQTEVSVKKILQYNELNYDAVLQAGQYIYLQPKRKRASRKQKFYTVAEGDDMYGISQKFAIKLKYLYKRNKMKVGEQPKAGTQIRLR